MELYIIAGPNGVGKTTFARTFLPKYADCKNFINADLIAQGISPFSPEAAAVRAGVPEAVVRRRFGRSISNFFAEYRRLADSWPSGPCRNPETHSKILCL
jgi:predicted ABC-type ATPase